VRTLSKRYEKNDKKEDSRDTSASLVELQVPKVDIAGLYLSISYFGSRMNGIEQAASRTGLTMISLTPRQAASLVARLKYPEREDAKEMRLRQIYVRTEHIVSLMSNDDVLGMKNFALETNAAV